MKIDRRITNGLAWAGVVLVVGIPAADLLSAQLMEREPAPQVAVIAPVAPMPAPLSQRPVAPTTAVAVAAPTKPVAEVAVAAPVKAVEPTKVATPASTQTASVVDTFLGSGKPLPSYITEAAQPQPTQVAATPPARTPIVTEAIDPVQVASIPAPAKVAPTPMPLSMRPQPAAPVFAAAAEPVLIVPDRVVAPLPPADITAGDLEDWESGPLSEFLASRQQQAAGGNADAYYDSDGFFLDDGPNRPRPQRDVYIGPAEESFFFPFSN